MKTRSWWIVELPTGRTMLHGTRAAARKALAYLREHGIRAKAFKVVPAAVKGRKR